MRLLTYNKTTIRSIAELRKIFNHFLPVPVSYIKKLRLFRECIKNTTSIKAAKIMEKVILMKYFFDLLKFILLNKYRKPAILINSTTMIRYIEFELLYTSKNGREENSKNLNMGPKLTSDTTNTNNNTHKTILYFSFDIYLLYHTLNLCKNINQRLSIRISDFTFT